MQRSGQGNPSPPDTTGPSGGGGLSPPTTAGGLFEAAQRDFNRGNYQLAIAGFDDFLKLSPGSDLADNAQYWKGESYYSLGDMDRAIQEFLKVRDVYPEGDAVAEATLKTGYAFLRKGDSATARRYFETVIREFPDSDEAGLAQDKLDSIR
jgi:tol-pal system protein YbgF